jgi:hypothetical protein
MTDAIAPSGRPLAGPFEGRRIGTTTRAVRIHELNPGGCLVECHDQAATGGRIQLQIELAGEGWISVEAETLYRRDHFRLAVKFVSLSDANRVRIERTIERLRVRQPNDVWNLAGPPDAFARGASAPKGGRP